MWVVAAHPCQLCTRPPLPPAPPARPSRPAPPALPLAPLPTCARSLNASEPAAKSAALVEEIKLGRGRAKAAKGRRGRGEAEDEEEEEELGEGGEVGCRALASPWARLRLHSVCSRPARATALP
jgi:hypothetical protein